MTLYLPLTTYCYNLIMSKEVIGIIGTIGAGKDTAGDYIVDKLGIPSFQISSPLKEICQERGIEPSRENLIALGTKLAATHGDGYLAHYILEYAPERVVITGMRQLGQIEALKNMSKLKLVAVDATPEIRFSRALDNGKLGEASTLKEFIAREIAENSPPNAQRLFKCMKLADYHLINNGTLEEFYKKLDKIII